MQTGKQTYSNLLKVFYNEILSKRMPLTFVKNKYKFSARDWVYFERLYVLWTQVQDSYAEINNRTFITKGLQTQLESIDKFKSNYNELLNLVKEVGGEKEEIDYVKVFKVGGLFYNFSVHSHQGETKFSTGLTKTLSDENINKLLFDSQPREEGYTIEEFQNVVDTEVKGINKKIEENNALIEESENYIALSILKIV